MKTRAAVAAAASAVLVLLVVPTLSPGARKGPFETKVFCLDGRRFEIFPGTMSDMSLLRRELHRQRVSLKLPDKPSPSAPSAAEALVEAGKGPARPKAALPAGFRIERHLRLESGAGTTEILFGGIDAGPRTILAGLEKSGWKTRIPGSTPGIPGFATITRGRESHVVFLEEKGGRFLLVGRIEK
jgi:hypothetical protein